jgi:hypothetical protein
MDGCARDALNGRETCATYTLVFFLPLKLEFLIFDFRHCRDWFQEQLLFTFKLGVCLDI